MHQGQWIPDTEFPADDEGHFVRASSGFRDMISTEPDAVYPAQAGRYHIYGAYACPWAHRVLIARELLGLVDVISFSAAEAYMGEGGWIYPAEDEIDHLWELYVRTDPKVSGRVTVPTLWDRQQGRIVNNESREILRMLTTQMAAFHREQAPDLCPEDLRDEIDRVIDAIYEPINNGVYRAGFARNQAAHEQAVEDLFDALDHWESVLGGQRFLCGDRFTEADICLFTTLLRFDAVYVNHFKCNLRRIVDYPNLWGFTRDIYQTPGIAGTVRMDEIKEHYFCSHPSVNPRGLVPLGPILDFTAPHDRARLGA